MADKLVSLKQKTGSLSFDNIFPKTKTVQVLDNNSVSIDVILNELQKQATSLSIKKLRSIDRSAVLTSGTEFTVPQYTVGYNGLFVYLDGIRCVGGVSYNEVGNYGETSTKITFRDDIPAAREIYVESFMNVSSQKITPYLTFTSSSAFTIKTNSKTWNKLEYSVDKTTWNEWNGTTATPSATVLYMRGTGNNIITGNTNNPFIITGSGVNCTGNIESLLDYETVSKSNHPSMEEYCFYGIFSGCTALVTAPSLESPSLRISCYAKMFFGCTSLTTAPDLPATEVVEGCYQSMFEGCTSLTIATDLPAKEAEENCYRSMFAGCTGLVVAPDLPATTLYDGCYQSMFSGCISLSNAPALYPTEDIGYSSYEEMFYGCTSLINIPILTSRSIDRCYYRMFYGCTRLMFSTEESTTTPNKAYKFTNEDITTIDGVEMLRDIYGTPLSPVQNQQYWTNATLF